MKHFKNYLIKLKIKLWMKRLLKKLLKTHLFSGEVKEVFKDPKKKVVILERVRDYQAIQ